VADNVLYGSDWPAPGVRSMKTNREDFERLGLPEEALAKMLDGNSRKIFP
jgi:predicted TIM-barrel fold metal-dependent hydrolase